MNRLTLGNRYPVKCWSCLSHTNEATTRHLYALRQPWRCAATGGPNCKDWSLLSFCKDSRCFIEWHTCHLTPSSSLRRSVSHLMWDRLVSALQTGQWSELTPAHSDCSRCEEMRFSCLTSRKWPLNCIVPPLQYLKSMPLNVLSSTVAFLQDSILTVIKATVLAFSKHTVARTL